MTEPQAPYGEDPRPIPTALVVSTLGDTVVISYADNRLVMTAEEAYNLARILMDKAIKLIARRS